MSSAPQKYTGVAQPHLRDYRSADDALSDLCDGLLTPEPAATGWQTVPAEEVPQPYAGLLVHENHMTTCLEDYHAQPVELTVLKHHLDGEVYRRMILLSLARSRRVVEYGLVRIDLTATPAPVRAAILQRDTPLGEILIRHDVLRRINPRWYLRFASKSTLLRCFGHAGSCGAFGRVGTIYCDEKPAVELLEVVTGVEV